MNISGIYSIESPSGKVYVGLSRDIPKRFKSYKYGGATKQPQIYKSIQKYGAKNHIFEVIEQCEDKDLEAREIFWKKHYLSLVENKMNKVLFAHLVDSVGGKKSIETRTKMGIGITKAKTNHPSYKNPKRGEKISKALKGRKRSAETIKKLTRPHTWNHKPVLQYTEDDIFIAEYESGIAAAKAMGKSK